MATRLDVYEPVLDVALRVVPELAATEEAEVRVPLHPEACGLAVDLNSLLGKFDRFIDSEIRAQGRKPVTVSEKFRDGVERKRLAFIFEPGAFEIPERDSFENYYSLTKLRLEGATDGGPEKPIMARARAAHCPDEDENPFLDEVQKGVALPPKRNRLLLNFSIESPSPFPFIAPFQEFDAVGAGQLKRTGATAAHYPISKDSDHRLKEPAWRFFQQPVYWHTWSTYVCIALNKMAGRYPNYDAAARDYGINGRDLSAHMEQAEKWAVDFLKALRTGTSAESFAASVGCPREYTGLLLATPQSTRRYFCNPQTLAEHREYLDGISACCKAYGFTITPEQLAQLTPARR